MYIFCWYCKNIHSFVSQLKFILVWLLPLFVAFLFIYTHLKFHSGNSTQFILNSMESYEFNWKSSMFNVHWMRGIHTRKKNRIRFTWIFLVYSFDFWYFIKREQKPISLRNHFQFLCHIAWLFECSMCHTNDFEFNPINGPSSIDLCSFICHKNSRITMRCINIFSLEN